MQTTKAIGAMIIPVKATPFPWPDLLDLAFPMIESIRATIASIIISILRYQNPITTVVPAKKLSSKETIERLIPIIPSTNPLFLDLPGGLSNVYPHIQVV